MSFVSEARRVVPNLVNDRVRPCVWYHIDGINGDAVWGWAVSPEGIASIRIWADGECLGCATYGNRRPDVAEHFPDAPSALFSGFGFPFPLPQDHVQRRQIVVEFVTCQGNSRHIIAGDVVLLPSGRTQVSTPSGANGLRLQSPPAPFPKEVIELLQLVDGAWLSRITSWDDVDMDEAVEKVRWVVSRAAGRNLAIFRYVGYLKQVWQAVEFAGTNFPRFNTTPSHDGKDAIAVATSPEEMLCIAHHLYVLRSYGLQGSVAEFGCFKGFSAACLSCACVLLGLEMDVFDSFQGLPASSSSYFRPGEFYAEVEEARCNVAQFGHLEVVQFHKGFFADTVPACQFRPLCIWADVDLNTSMADVMRCLPRLPVASCVFSHEVSPQAIVGGRIQQSVDPDSVIPPIVKAFETAGRQIMARHVGGLVGAFWDSTHGYPVLPLHLVQRLRQLMQ